MSESCPQLKTHLLEIVENNTVGSPVDQNLKWTHLPLTQIVRRLAERGIRACRKTARKILRSLQSKTSHDLSDSPITHDRHRPDYNDLIQPKASEQ